MLERLQGNTSPWAVEERAKILRVLAEHEEHHLSARRQLDDAGLRACISPNQQWTIVVDAATQRNFQLPKLGKRLPKSLAGRPFWEYKLMCAVPCLLIFFSGVLSFLTTGIRCASRSVN